MDFELFQSISKYPFIYQNEFYSSDEISQNKTCLQKCTQKDCLKLFDKQTDSEEYVCSNGYDNVLLISEGKKFIINGLIFNTNTTIHRGRREARQEWICMKEAVMKFIKKIHNIDTQLVTRENETTIKNFAIFHDFKTSMNIFFACTQDIINNLPGKTFEEKLDHSGKSYQDLYQALRLITSQLGMIDVLINPESILFGSKKLINIYKMFDKYSNLFEHMAARKRNISIELQSASWISDSYCYDSIEFIPLILLDNALKYSAPDSKIEIKMEQKFRRVKVDVKNIGPAVSDENKERIFEKFFRDESAKAFSKNGIGIGLWVAQQILEAHQCRLFYHKDPNETRPLKLNIFSFELPTEP